MADRPKDDNENDESKLRLVPSNVGGPKDGPPGLPEDFGSETEEVVFLRRREKRLAAQNRKDYPWTRRIVGSIIVIAAIGYGWKILNRRSDELIRQRARENQNVPLAIDPNSIAGRKLDQPILSAQATPAPATVESAKLDPMTMTTIADCTKGANAFRQIDVGRSASASGQATLESVFAPVMLETQGRARRAVQLQNVRIRTTNGEEWRLHASPRVQGGELYLKLFRVAPDGLPEPIEFPDGLKGLADAKLSDETVNSFLQFSESPGHALEIERHESWSYSEKAGAQLILSDNQIFDIQVFMRDRFLACSRGVKAGAATVTCKCVERGRGQ